MKGYASKFFWGPLIALGIVVALGFGVLFVMESVNEQDGNVAGPLPVAPPSMPMPTGSQSNANSGETANSIYEPPANLLEAPPVKPPAETQRNAVAVSDYERRIAQLEAELRAKPPAKTEVPAVAAKPDATNPVNVAPPKPAEEPVPESLRGTFAEHSDSSFSLLVRAATAANEEKEKKRQTERRPAGELVYENASGEKIYWSDEPDAPGKKFYQDASGERMDLMRGRLDGGKVESFFANAARTKFLRYDDNKIKSK